MIEPSVKLKGGNYLFGDISLSGDTDNAICLTTYLIFKNRVNTIISNVPRSPYFLKYYEICQMIGIRFNWISEDKIIILENKHVNNDISFFSEPQYFDIARVLLAMILMREGECILDPAYRSEAKFLRTIGYVISAKEEKLRILRPKTIQEKTKVDSSSDDIYGVTSKLMLVEDEYSELTLNGLEKNSNYILFQEQINTDKSELKCNFNLKEINFFLSLGRYSNTEINFKNFDLVQFFKILSLYGKIGLRYEVLNDTLKIWRDLVQYKNFYDLTPYSVDQVGYFILGVSESGLKRVRLLVMDNPLIKNIIVNLNIMGLSISYSTDEKSTKYALLDVKSAFISPVKNIELDPMWGGVIVSAACKPSGVTSFTNFNDYAERFRYFKENLSSLNVSLY
jgi:hypothetical protein